MSAIGLQPTRKLAGETRVLLLILVTATAAILIRTDGDLVAGLIFGSCGAIFLAERVALGDSLSLNFPTLPSLFLLVYMVTTSLSSIFVFTAQSEDLALVGGRSIMLPQMGASSRYTYFLAVQSVLVTFPLGVALANRLFKNPSEIVRAYLTSHFTKSARDSQFFPMILLATLLLGPLLLPYFVFARHIQLIDVLKSYPTAIDPLALRMAEASLPKTVQFGFEIARRFILPVCALYAYLMSYLYGGRWGLLFGFYFAAAFAASALTLDRAEPVALVVGIIFAHILSRRLTIGSAIRTPRLIALFGFAVTIGSVISMVQYQRGLSHETFLEYLWRILVVRIGSDPAYMTSWAFRIFDRPSLFLHFRYERVFSFLPGFKYIEWNDGYFFVTPPLAFVGNLWENWGWPAVLLGSSATGFVYQFIQLSAFKRKTVPTLAIQVVMLASAAWTVYGKVLSIMSVSILSLGFIIAYLFRDKGRDLRTEFRAATTGAARAAEWRTL